MTNYIKKYALQRLQSYSWMDEDTRNTALYKVHLPLHAQVQAKRTSSNSRMIAGGWGSGARMQRGEL